MDIEEQILTLEKTIKDALRQIDELRDQQYTHRFKPKHGEKYWSIDSDGDIRFSYYYASNSHNRYSYATGNCYKTEEEAQQVVDKGYDVIRQQIKDIASELNNGTEIDWTEKYIFRYHLCVAENEIVEDSNWKTKVQGAIYCLDKNFKDECIKRIGEARLIEYLKS